MTATVFTKCPFWVAVVAAALVAVTLSTSAGRKLAQRWLGSLRLQKVQAVDMDLLAGARSSHCSRSSASYARTSPHSSVAFLVLAQSSLPFHRRRVANTNVLFSCQRARSHPCALLIIFRLDLDIRALAQIPS